MENASCSFCILHVRQSLIKALLRSEILHFPYRHVGSRGGSRDARVCIARSLDSRGTLLAEQLSWMAEPWVSGAWDPQLFLPGKLLGRGLGRVPLGAGKRAVSASPNLEGNTVALLRQHGPFHPLRVLRHLQNHLHPSVRAVPPRSDRSSPVPLSGSPEPCSHDVMIPLDTVHLTFKCSCQFFALLPFSKVFQIC